MKKITCTLIGIVISGDRKVIQEISRKYFKTQQSNSRSRAMWNVKIKLIPVIMRGNRNNLKIFQKNICTTSLETKKTETYEKQLH